MEPKLDDALGKTFDLVAMTISIFFALRPDWSFKILSYGKASARDISPNTLLVMRLLGAFCALVLFVDLTTSFFKN